MQRIRVCVCVYVCARAHVRACMYVWDIHSGGHVGNWYLVVNVLCVTHKLCHELGCRSLCVWWARWTVGIWSPWSV